MGHATEDENGVISSFKGRFAIDRDGVRYPLKHMSAADKAALGVFEVTEDPPPAEPGLVVVSHDLVRDGDRVRRRPVTERASDEQLIAGIKAEAGRRIVAFLPEWKQRNLLAQASILAEKGRDNWTPDELAAWDAGAAAWAHVAAIRARSDQLEAMVPLPTDYDDNRHWP